MPVAHANHRSNNFDTIRLFAAFLVLFSHQFALTSAAGSGAEPQPFKDVSFGGIGVMTFFSLSGFLISKSWRRSPDVVAFIRNRLLRIWPAFAVVTLLDAFVLGPLVTSNDLPSYFTSRETLGHVKQLFFVMRYTLPGVFDDNPFPRNVNGPLWTLPIEVSWYGVLLVSGVTGLLNRRYFLLGIAAVSVATMLFVIYGSYPARRFPLEFGIFFVVGMVISAFEQDLVHHLKATAAVVLAVVFVSLYLKLDLVALVAFIPLSAIVLGRLPSPFERLSISRWAKRWQIGDFSYGVYLYAWPVQQTTIWYFDNQLSLVQGLVLTALLTTVLAIASWKLVEAPALRLKSTTRSKSGQTVAA